MPISLRSGASGSDPTAIRRLFPAIGPRLRRCARALACAAAIVACNGANAAPAALPNPILFVTQFPIPGDFASIGSVFANHLGDIETVGRGGDLYIRYPDGTLRNLTQEAGYGQTGMQGETSIAVRDPAVHWSGTKALFSMVIGAPTSQYEQGEWFWQIYEITGFGQGQTVSITRVPGQHANYNNVQPTYGSDDSIIFVGDEPRNGQRHLYPQHDEYESTASPTGLWKLDPATGNLMLMQHSPSGSFDPFVDSFGRVIFTRWDHLQRDQQADAGTYGTFNYSSEAADAQRLDNDDEYFPEPRHETPAANGFSMNQFFPWMVNQDGGGEETINHIGRHELSSYFNYSLLGDPSLHEFIAGSPPRTNQNSAENWLQIAEDPTTPGRYLAINGPEFYTHASGQLVSIYAPPGARANTLSVTYLTSKSTATFYENNDPPANFTGHYRNPMPLSDGQLISSWAAYAGGAGNLGTRSHPDAAYKFQLQRLVPGEGGFVQAGEALTGGISKSISYYDPDVLVTYDGPLWELSPVEVRVASAPPPMPAAAMESPETQAFALEGVDVEEFSAFLKQRGLAVLVSRNVTARDSVDEQQPYNLRVPGGTQTLGNNGHVYDISYMQMLQGDQIRGIGGVDHPRPGRRVIAQPMHDEAAFAFMPPRPPGAPQGAVGIAADGSAASIVPARRALAWQTTAPDGTPVVRERYWISAQAGEVRACDGCHGVNDVNQAGLPPAQNVPQALRELLAYWRDHHDSVFLGNFEP
jgi:hypothetical protein